MEVKWISIMVAVTFSGLFLGIGFDHYHASQCKIAAIEQHMAPDDIVKLCK